jgi:hypothetical protein
MTITVPLCNCIIGKRGGAIENLNMIIINIYFGAKDL